MEKSFGRFLGIGLICLSMLAYETLSARLLSVVLEGSLIIFAIAFAMLGMGIATSFQSLRDSAAPPEPIRFSYWATVLGLSYLGSLFALTLLNDASNSVVEAAISRDDLRGLVAVTRANMAAKMCLVAAVLSVPYLVFGVLIGNLFSAVREGEYHRLYASDLIGAAVGCLLSVVALDSAGYAGGVGLVFLSAFLGAAAFAWRRSSRIATLNVILAICAVALVSVPPFLSKIEPRPVLNQLARNYDNTADVTETWHVWNAHSRVALLSLRNHQSGQLRHVYAHEDGSGWANVPNEQPYPWAKLVTAFEPKRVLVLFAGVGADMAEIDRLCNGECEITGVEINGDMVDHWITLAPEESKAFLARLDTRLVVQEAREFLERDNSRYDAILLSWWGAGASYYVGTSGKLAQYLYTAEAYRTLLEHLTPNGTLTVLNGSKAQTLVTLRDVFEKREIGGLDGKVIILKEPADRNAKIAGSGFYDTLEMMRLIVKPSGFTLPELETIQGIAAGLNANVILSPGHVDPAYSTYGEIVDGADLDSVNARLIASADVELSVVTDDRPFTNELVPRRHYMDPREWFQSGAKSISWLITETVVKFVISLAVVTALLTFSPLLLRSGPKLSKGNLMELAYFGSLGAGFILIEVGLVRKFGLLLGHPSYSISVVLASLIFSTGIGSLVSHRLFDAGLLTVRRTASLIAVYAVGGLFLYQSAVGYVIGLPLAVKCAIVIVALAPLGLLMGQLFPQGLLRVSNSDQRLIPWAWAINSTSSTLFVGIGYLISYPLGFNALIYLGAAIYLGLIALPLAAVKRPRPAFAG